MRNSLVVGLGLVAAISLFGCSQAPESASPEQASVPSVPVTEGATGTISQSTATPVLRGYYEAVDGGLFTACGETSRRRVLSFSEQMREALRMLSGMPDQARFMVTQGRLIGRDEVELGAFELISGDAWTCESRLQDFLYGARGEDGSWSLEVTRAAITFIAAPGTPPAVFAYRPLEEKDGALNFVDGQSDTAFSIDLQPTICLDRMTDSVFALKATVSSSDQSYQGCAWRGIGER
jgi:uncharacterized membrane protein